MVDVGWPRSCALLLLLTACGPDGQAQETGGVSTGSGGTADGSTTTSVTTGGDPTTTATTTTGEPPTTGSGETGEGVPCVLLQEPCGGASICIEIFGGDYVGHMCVPNPDGCIPDTMCSAACQALCVEYSNGICPQQDPATPHTLHCPEFIACNTFDVESGCPEGQKCNPRHHCAPLDPDPIPVGEPCTKLHPDPCVAGAYCAFGAAELQGTCRPFCTGTVAEPVCPADSDCADIGDIFVCLPTCDPLAPACSDTEVCAPNPNKDGLFLCAPDASLEGGALFSPCEYANGRDPGLYCSEEKIDPCDLNIYGCCLPYCDLDMPVCPDMGLECAS